MPLIRQQFFFLFGLASLIILLLPYPLLAGPKGLPEGEARVKVGDRAPLETEELMKAHAEGKSILLMFGNPWHCLYCERIWMTIKDELIPRYGEDLAFVLVTSQRVKFWEPLEEHVKLARRYGIIGEPWLFLIDREGRVRQIFIGFTKREKIDGALKKLFARKDHEENQ